MRLCSSRFVKVAQLYHDHDQAQVWLAAISRSRRLRQDFLHTRTGMSSAFLHKINMNFTIIYASIGCVREVMSISQEFFENLLMSHFASQSLKMTFIKFQI